jgi:crossover junction endodeoxyribonuclease RuvC
MITIGIDPGQKGGIALIRDSELIYAEHLPVINKQLSAPLLASWFRDIEPDRPNKVVIERVGAMPGQGVTSMFNFGYGAGIIEGVTGTLGYAIEFVTPSVWKRDMGLTGKDKHASRQLAARLYPKQADLFARAKDEGPAEAALIAHWGQR